ncbi:MAG TPA: hypothetical protein VNV16_04930 [Methylibium sp.]|mgnify:CR=1 FL=1|nr:hypothetical protein [Methylibium sp.]
MTEQQVRTMLVEALDAANVFAMREKQLAEGFLAGIAEVPLDTLEMDSLAEMELCIAIEIHAGVSVVPDQLRQIGSLQRLAMLVHGERAP